MKLENIPKNDHKKAQEKAIFNKYKYFFYYKIFVLNIFAVLGIIGIFNYLIDPYGLYGNSVGINNLKWFAGRNDRLYKAADIIRMKPQIVILGSSRVKLGIDPKSVIFTKSGTVYNAGINGPTTYEIYRYLEHTIKNSPYLQEVILGIDFTMFKEGPNKPTFSEARLGKENLDLQDILDCTFSLDAITTSVQTIMFNRARHEQDINDYGLNGFINIKKVLNIKKDESIWRFNKSIPNSLKEIKNYQLSEKYLEYFKKIVQLCQAKKIKLRIFITPAHATNLEEIYIAGKWNDFERWKREIVKLTPVWDFYYYNSVTNEPIKKQ